MHIFLKTSLAFCILFLINGCKSSTKVSYELDQTGKEFQDYPTNITTIKYFEKVSLT